MLSSNIETKNTNIDIDIDIDIDISIKKSIRVNVNNETGYYTNVRQINKRSGRSEPLINFDISGDFDHPIILPDSLQELSIRQNSIFNQPIILPNSLQAFSLDGMFNQPIIIPNSLRNFEIYGKILNLNPI